MNPKPSPPQTPSQVLLTLAEIEDRLAEMEAERAELSGKVTMQTKFFKAYAHQLMKYSDAGSAKAAEIDAWAIIHEGKEWHEHLAAVERSAALDTEFDNLTARATIGQSRLGFLKAELQFTQGYGQSKGQPGVGES